MTIFAKIIAKEIPCTLVFENERIIAFHDIAPKAPVHILVVPKKPIPNLLAMTEEDQAVCGEMMFVIKHIAEQYGLTSFRCITNIGPDAGQQVYHLHFHILGGRLLGDLG